MGKWKIPGYWNALGDVRDRSYRWRWGAGSEFHLSEKYVPGEGADYPRVMIIGEAPGAQEDAVQRPFVGASGYVLRSLMEIAVLHTDDFEDTERKIYGVGNSWITNVVKFRPLPNNRTPGDEEIKFGRKMLRREWVAIGKPRIIVPVGGVASLAVLGQKTSILRISGHHLLRTSNVDGELMHVWPMVHPSFGLRSPNIQPLIERDWEKLGEWLRDAVDSR